MKYLCLEISELPIFEIQMYKAQNISYSQKGEEAARWSLNYKQETSISKLIN